MLPSDTAETNHMQLMFPLGMNLIFPRTPAYTQKQEVKRLARHAAVCDADALSRSMFFAGFLSSRWVNMVPWDVSQKTTFYQCISQPRHGESKHTHTALGTGHFHCLESRQNHTAVSRYKVIFNHSVCSNNTVVFYLILCMKWAYIG